MLFHCKCQLNHLSVDSNIVSLFVNWLGLSNPNSNLMMRRAGLSISAAKIKGFMIMEWHFLHRWHSVKVSQQSLSRLVDHPYLWRFTPEWWYHNGWFNEFTMLLMMNIWLSCQMLIVIIEMLWFDVDFYEDCEDGKTQEKPEGAIFNYFANCRCSCLATFSNHPMMVMPFCQLSFGSKISLAI